jgi:hypothetical protein
VSSKDSPPTQTPPPDDADELIVGVGRGERRGAPLREMESPAPVAMGRGGGHGVGAHGGRGGARHWVISGGIRGCHGGVGGHYSGAPRTLEEEEAGLLQLEVSSTFPVRP